VRSPEFTCFGHRWLVVLYPNGGPNSTQGMVGVFLYHMSSKGINVEFVFGVKDSRGRDVSKCGSASSGSRCHFDQKGGEVCHNKGRPNFAKRSDIMDSLVEGSLIMEVRMRRVEPSASSTSFIPENPCANVMIHKIFMDEKSADVEFSVEDGGDQKDENSRKRTATSHIKFHAHRLILSHCAPDLAALCGTGSGLASVPVTGVKPNIFRSVLFYVYGGKVKEEDLESHAKEIICAADRFGVVNLKLEAEASYVESTAFSVDNVMENLLYADATNCALLKEAVMDFIVENRAEVLKKVSLKDAPGGLLADLLAATTRKFSQETGTADSDDDFNAMDISKLRKKAHEKGLEMDGSREVLIATLEENA